MKKNWVYNLSKALCVALAFIFGIVCWGRWLALENTSIVSSFLNQKTYETISVDGKNIDPLTGVRNPDYSWYYKPEHATIAELKAEADLVCEQVELEGAVLLYNKSGTYDGVQKNALPINKQSKVSMFSTGSIRPHLAGQGSHGTGTYTKENTYVKAFAQAGHTVNQLLWDRYYALHGDPSGTGGDTSNKYRRNRNSYSRNYKLGDIPWSDLYVDADQELKDSVEEYNDAAIFCITRQGGEGVDMWAGSYGSQYAGQGNGVDMLKLNSNERSVLVGLTELKRAGKIKRIIINLNTSNSVGLEFMNDANIDIDAVIWTGGYGESGIFAVPKLLDGTANFSGSLPFTAYYDNWDCPGVSNIYNGVEASNVIGSMMNYTNISDFGRSPDQYTTTYIVYQEGIYVDYRYPETRYEDVVMGRARTGNFDYNEVIAFTHGTSLSYSEYQLTLVGVEPIPSKGNDYKVTVSVKNTGNVAGKKAVQVYAQKPYGTYDITNKIEKSAVDFVGFGKTKILQPGESETLEITVFGRDFLAAYDANEAKTYVVTPGTYYLALGNNAHDALNNILAAKGKTVSDGMDYNGNRNLTWSTEKTLDKTTFAVSRATGYAVTNLFDESDINKYSGRGSNSVNYVTRNNWEGTLTFFDLENPTYVKLEATAQMFIDENVGQEATEEEKSNREYPEYGRNYAEDPLLDKNGEVILSKNLTVVDLYEDEHGNPIPITDERWDWLMNQMTWEEMARLVSVGQRHTEAAASIGLPSSFNYNESNGIANPSWDCFDTGKKVVSGSIKNKALATTFEDPDKGGMAELWPANCVFTATLNRELAEKAGKIWGEEGNWAGLSGLYGPGFNFYRTAYGGRNYEYFGADPYGAGMMGASLVKGMQSMGLFAVIKHFAFNDQEAVRKAACLWLTEQTAREIYLRTFEYPIADGGALCVMGSMGRMGAPACNANESLMTGWLKNETGLKGFATTDISFSSTKPAMLKAGSDLFDNDSMSGNNSLDPYKPVEGQTEGYGEFAWRMRDAAKRVAYTVLHSNAINGLDKGLEMRALTPQWIGVVDGVTVTCGILCVASFIFLAAVVVFREMK